MTTLSVAPNASRVLCVALLFASWASLYACSGDGTAPAQTGGETTDEIDPPPDPATFNNIYYVDQQAVDDTGTGALGDPKKYIKSAIALMSANGNDAVVIAPGTYEGPSNAIDSLVSGRDGAYNVIKAATEGSVVLRELALPNSAAYVRFEGLKWDSATTKGIRGHHLKFLRCAFSGGPATGNTTTLSIGTNDMDPGAQHVLLEDVWVYGLGGRYNIVVFNADKVVLRRAVVRHDGGWGGNGSDPEAGIAIYNSTDTLVQNALVMDSSGVAYTYWEAAFYHVKNASTARAHTGTQVVGSMALNNLGAGFSYDDAGPIGAALSDSVSWANELGVSVNDKGPTSPGHRVVVSGMTIGATGGHGVAMYGGGPNTLSLRNSIVTQVGGDLFRVSNGSLSQTFNNCYAPTGVDCAHAFNPSTSGLLFLPRIEAGSALAGAGEAGARVGARLVNRLGVFGRLHGERGYADETEAGLWPWPYEARIRADMCAVTPPRGWCATTVSLTEYVWNYLGNGVPAF